MFSIYIYSQSYLVEALKIYALMMIIHKWIAVIIYCFENLKLVRSKLMRDTLSVNNSNTLIKGWKLSDWIKKQ